MAGATTFTETRILNGMFRHAPTTTIDAANASTTNILVTSSTGFSKGHLVKGTTAGSYHLVTAVPDATHVTVTPAFAAAPTTGSLEVWAYQPNLVAVALFTALPSDAGGGTEVSGGDYSRKALTQATGTWNAPAGAPSLIDNVAAIEWLNITWAATVVGWGLMDETTLATGNLILWFDSVDKTAAAGDNVRFAAGALDVTHD